MNHRPTKIRAFVLSPHSADRMRERNISSAKLREVLDHPDAVMEQGPKWIFAKDIKGRQDNKIAAVVIEKKEGLWVVITILVRFEVKR